MPKRKTQEKALQVPIPSATVEKFKEWVASLPGKQTEAADILKLSRSFVCLMEQGKRRPKFHSDIAYRIQERMGIRTQDWFPSSESEKAAG